MLATLAILLGSILVQSPADQKAPAPQQPPRQAGSGQKTADWRTDWSVDEGFALSVDASGFRFPTSIAVVPEPGPGPDAPLYFVAELGGNIKVVTRDHQVHPFVTDVFKRQVARELPDEAGGSGMAGLCLAPAQGLVFATYGYRDQTGTFRNAIIRFESDPVHFGLAAKSEHVIAAITQRFRGAPSHQIGTCAVEGPFLYVGIGDGMQPADSRNPSMLLGKILRMTLDGRPAPGNPLAVADTSDARNYVYALGLRNPFAVQAVHGHVLVGDNGPSVDRFLDVAPGADYLWDGSDWSMATNTAAVFVPSPAPVQMAYAPASDTGLPAALRGRFFVAMAGLESSVGPPTRKGARGIVVLNYDLDKKRMLEVPRSIFRYRGAGHQSVVGVAVASQGLYVVPLFPDVSGASSVLHLTYDPEHQHPYLVLEGLTGWDLILERGCIGCHAYADRRLGTTGPALDQDSLVQRLTQRLASPAYASAVAELDKREDEPYRSFRAARHAVLASTGAERLKLWIRYRIEEPRFDNPNSLMPNLRVPAGEAENIASFLVSGSLAKPPSRWEQLRERFVSRRAAYAVAVFLGGVILGFGLASLQRRSRRQPA